jgi:O-antigen ligase
MMTSASRARRASANSRPVVFALVAVGVLLVTFNAVRPVPSATAADLVFAVALLGIVLTPLDSHWTARPIAPAWLLTAAGLLLCAALLVGIFPARPSQAVTQVLSGVASNAGASSEFPAVSNAGAAVRLVGTLVFLPVLIALAANSRRRILVLADVWIAGAAFGALLGALGYLGVAGVAHLIAGGSDFQGSGVPRVAGLSTHSNHFALASAMALPVAATRLGQANGRTRVYFSVVVLVLISAIAISGSRAGLIGGLFGLALLTVLRPESRKGVVRTVIVAVMLAGVVAVVLSPPPTVERLSNAESAATSTQQRKAVYTAVWHDVRQRPLIGHGFQYVRGSEDIYLQLLDAGGIIALGGFGIFAIGSLTSGFRLGRRDSLPDDMQSLARAACASLAVWLIAAGIVLPAIFDRYLYVPVGLIIAISASGRPDPRNISEHVP